MARYYKQEVLGAVTAQGMIPVFYNSDIQTSKNVLKACYDGGVRMFEFTNRGDKAAEVFQELAAYAEKELPGLILGVGSICDAASARKFIRLGANFVVGPMYSKCVMRTCKLRKIPYMPGCGSVTEVATAQRAGCDICKVFPGDVLGPAFVKALRGPMPWSKLMVTGGVKPAYDNLSGWFKAGAVCVGIGSNLFPKDALASNDWERISNLCRETLDTISKLK